MKVGFTGTRKGLSEHQMELLRQFFRENEILEFHHGDSIGADTQAHQIYLEMHPGKKVFLHPTSKDRGWTSPKKLDRFLAHKKETKNEKSKEISRRI